MEGARNRRRGEREDVDLEPERAQELLLRHAEALLLVEDDQTEILRDHVAREDAVGSDEDVDLASWNSCRTRVWSARERNRDTISTRTGKSR